MPHYPKRPPLSLALLTIGLTGSLHAQTTISADTVYNASNFSGQVLTAGAADLGTAEIKFSNLSNTTWSASPTATPSFTGFGGQAFRQTVFTGADWSGLSFTSGASGNQFFYQANFTNANFSGTTFNMTAGGAAFGQTDLSGANFSNSYINVGAQTSLFDSATFSSTTNFSGATIIASGSGNTPASLNGADFSNATLRISFIGTDLSNASFRNTTFVASDGINSVIRNSVANLTDFRGTDFTGNGFGNWLPSLTWDEGMAPIYDETTIFTTQNGTFDPVAAGWTLYTAPIPEPSSYALILGGLCTAIATMRRQPRHA